MNQYFVGTVREMGDVVAFRPLQTFVVAERTSEPRQNRFNLSDRSLRQEGSAKPTCLGVRRREHRLDTIAGRVERGRPCCRGRRPIWALAGLLNPMISAAKEMNMRMRRHFTY